MKGTSPGIGTKCHGGVKTKDKSTWIGRKIKNLNKRSSGNYHLRTPPGRYRALLRSVLLFPLPRASRYFTLTRPAGMPSRIQMSLVAVV